MLWLHVYMNTCFGFLLSAPTRSLLPSSLECFDFIFLPVVLSFVLRWGFIAQTDPWTPYFLSPSYRHVPSHLAFWVFCSLCLRTMLFVISSVLGKLAFSRAVYNEWHVLPRSRLMFILQLFVWMVLSQLLVLSSPKFSHCKVGLKIVFWSIVMTIMRHFLCLM